MRLNTKIILNSGEGYDQIARLAKLAHQIGRKFDADEVSIRTLDTPQGRSITGHVFAGEWKRMVLFAEDMTDDEIIALLASDFEVAKAA